MLERQASRALTGFFATIVFGMNLAVAAPVSTFDSTQFRVSVLATGLNFPYSMSSLAGRIVFGSSTTGFGGTGSLLAIPDTGGPVQTLLTGLNGPVTGVRLTDDLQVPVVSYGNANSRQVSFFDAGTLANLGSVNFSYPDPVNYVHGTGAEGLRADPGLPGATDLFFNVGSQFGDHVGTVQITASGLVSMGLNQASIYEMVFSRNGNSIVVSTVQQLASGVRNGFGFDPLQNGDLAFTDNADAVGQDELNLLPASSLGTSVVNFGFLDDTQGCYIDRNGNPVGTGCVQPIFSPAYALAVGATDVVSVPDGFGNLGGGYLIAFHGLQGNASTQSAVIYWNPITNQSFPFLPNQDGVGHPDTLLFLDSHTLLVGDFAENGLVGPSGAGTGQILEIQAESPEPGTFLLIGTGMVLLLRRRVGCGRRG